MLNINFVPDDYIQSNESQRTNLLYLALFLVVMIGLGGVFLAIKLRQRALNNKQKMVRTKLEQAKEDIKKFEELQEKFKIMSKTALTTAELLEPVPRSVLLASLTNNLPKGVSLLKLDLIQKEPQQSPSAPVASSKFEAVKNKSDSTPDKPVSREKLVETYIDIEGISPTDLQVASYIEQLSSSALLDNVALIESKEYKVTDQHSYGATKSETILRQFKLKAMLQNDLHITSQDVEKIRNLRDKKTRVF
jgi:Tfp pilus assembly protein PilN